MPKCLHQMHVYSEAYSRKGDGRWGLLKGGVTHLTAWMSPCNSPTLISGLHVYSPWAGVEARGSFLFAQTSFPMRNARVRRRLCLTRWGKDVEWDGNEEDCLPRFSQRVYSSSKLMGSISSWSLLSLQTTYVKTRNDSELHSTNAKAFRAGEMNCKRQRASVSFWTLRVREGNNSSGR